MSGKRNGVWCEQRMCDVWGRESEEEKEKRRIPKIAIQHPPPSHTLDNRIKPRFFGKLDLLASPMADRHPLLSRTRSEAIKLDGDR